jgi:glycine/D-amino acid oxidase-like deaminating enzyme
MSQIVENKRWGSPPWVIDFRPRFEFPKAAGLIPDVVDVAIVGGGFTGLATAACLRKLDPSKSVVMFEAETIGAGASGHTGGMCLGETAAGPMPGLGDVLRGFKKILRELEVDCDLHLPGAWELARKGPGTKSEIHWNDSGDLHVVKNVRGGSIDPGKMVSRLARTAEKLGAMIFENTRVDDAVYESPIRLKIGGREVRAKKVLFATNALSLELNGLLRHAEPKFTLALATEPLNDAQLSEIGLASRKSFYTVDFPYLWGRLLATNGVIFGSGLVHFKDWRELLTLDVGVGDSRDLMTRLEERVHALHAVLRDVKVTHRWGGPILIAQEWKPIFSRHPKSEHALVIGAYSGHGVALSVYLGNWAARVLLGRKKLPKWKITAA